MGNMHLDIRVQSDAKQLMHDHPSFACIPSSFLFASAMCYAEKCLACEQLIDKHLAGLVLIASLCNSFMANISMKILLTVCHTFLIIFF